jgi:hypothetical protein
MGCSVTADSVKMKSAMTTTSAVLAMKAASSAAMRHQHEEGDAAASAENDDGAEHMQILDEEIEHQRFPAGAMRPNSSARSSSAPASFTPPSLSASQCPSPPQAGSTLNAGLPPASRKASASCFENAGEK